MLRIQKGPLSKDSPLISFSLTMSTIMFPLTVSPLRYVAVDRSNSTRKVFNDGIVHLRSHSRQNYFYYVRIFFIVPRVYYRMTFERKQKIYIRVERTIIHRIRRNFSDIIQLPIIESTLFIEFISKVSLFESIDKIVNTIHCIVSLSIYYNRR